MVCPNLARAVPFTYGKVSSRNALRYYRIPNEHEEQSAQQALVKGATRWLSMPPDRRSQAQQRFQRWRAFTPEERREIRGRYREFNNLPPDEQARVRRNFQRFQNLKGNQLPNAPKNKLALNVNYTIETDSGDFNLSGSYIWRDNQYGTLFSRSYNQSPAWDQVDARVTWDAPNGKTRVIAYVKNLFDDIGYDAGAVGYRFAGLPLLTAC